MSPPETSSSTSTRTAGETALTAPLKTFADRVFTALTDVELAIGMCLLANVIFAADRLAGVIR